MTNTFTAYITSFRRTALAVLASVALASASQFAAAATIGLMAPLSRPQAIVGQDQVDGFMPAVEQLGGKLGGQPANVLKDDALSC